MLPHLFHGVVDFINEFIVIEGVFEIRGLSKSVRIIRHAHSVRQNGPNGDFDAFHRVHDQEAKFTIKNIEINDVVDGCSMNEIMSATTVRFLLKGSHVTGKSVITRVFKKQTRPIPVIDIKTTSFTKVDQFLNIFGRFFEYQNASTKKYPLVRIKERRGSMLLKLYA